MAKTIPQLTDATTVGASDEMIIQQSGITKRATINELKTQVAALGANDITVSGANRSITNTTNHALIFGTNNTERVRITNSGKVGIGDAATDPLGDLEVRVSGGNPQFRIISNEDSVTYFVSAVGNADVRMGVASSHPLRFYTGNAPRGAFDTSGNFIVGTPSALSRLHVDGDLTVSSATTGTAATAGSNGDVPAQVAGYLVVSINGTSRKIPYYAT
jgi:hypothetical protein